MMTGICGGIGSGKSVVSRILRLRGEAVYDCDLEAKRIMDCSSDVLASLNQRYGDVVCPPGGPICRQALASRVFGCEEDRLWLNSLVHRLVREDVSRWYAARMSEGQRRCFVESAILASSGLAAMCSAVWIVKASEEVRVERIKKRDAMQEEAIINRIRSQQEEERLLDAIGVDIHIIDNSGRVPLLGQLL